MTYSLHCRDLVWSDRSSLQNLLAYVAGNTGMGIDWRWYGPNPEPLIMLAGGQDAITVQSTEFWMSRLVDVETALQARGYPRTLTGTIELEVSDTTLPANTRCLHLEWLDGELRIDSAPRGGLRLGVDALAPIFTGRLVARDAVRLGLLEGARERDIAMLEAAFLGSPPWLADIF
jgi:predicted acetyltransferase